MDKYFICLANSYKHHGRCIAGIELTKCSNGWHIVRGSDQNPKWIRPVTAFATGEFENSLAEKIKILSIVKLTDVHPYPAPAQPENVRFSTIETVQEPQPLTAHMIDSIVDKTARRVLIENRGVAVIAEKAKDVKHSLMFIRATNARAYINEKCKFRMSFDFRGTSYTLAITDPLFMEKLKSGQNIIKESSEVYLTISLATEFNSWHSKLVAGVFIFDNWFKEYDKKLNDLLNQKRTVIGQIEEIRSEILKKMEMNHETHFQSDNLSITYNPPLDQPKFDMKSFREDHPDLYEAYCKIQVKKASLYIKQNRKGKI